MKYRFDIQGLRALAFLFVFIYHLNSSWLPGGFIGVDMFLVISGYLMTGIISDRIIKNKFNFVDFFDRRIRRIVPVYFAMLLVVSLFTVFFYLHSDVNQIKGWVKSSFLFISNIDFAKSDNYFGAKSYENPILHTWSLSLEMQFYFILPFLLYFVDNRWLKVLIIIIIVLLISYSYINIVSFDNKAKMYFSLFARIPEFLIGSLLFYYSHTLAKYFSKFSAYIGMALLLLSCFFINETRSFPGFLILLPCIGISLIIISNDSPVNRLLSSRPLVWLGELSYSLYLWHWPIMAYIRYRKDVYDFSIFEVVSISALTLIFAIVSYYFIEKRFINFGKSKIYTILLGASVVIVCFVKFAPILNNNVKDQDLYSKPIFGMDSHNHLKISKYGFIDSNNDILLIGDSHSLAFKALLDTIGKNNKFSFHSISTDSYPPLKGLIRSEVANDIVSPNNYSFFDNAVTTAEFLNGKLKSYSLIIITVTRYDRIPSEVVAVKELIKSLEKHQKIILIDSYPKLNKSPLRASLSINSKKSQKFKYLHDNIPFELKNLVDGKKVFYYSLKKARLFKQNPYVNDTTLYYDRGHLNYYGAVKLGQELESEILELLLQIRPTLSM